MKHGPHCQDHYHPTPPLLRGAERVELDHRWTRADWSVVAIVALSLGLIGLAVAFLSC